MKIIYSLLIIVFFLFFQSLQAQTTGTSSVKSTNAAQLDEYPNVPEKLLNTEITLIDDDKKIKLSDYKNDLIVLSFVAEWAKPARITVSDLKTLYTEKLKTVRIIAVATEDGKSDKLNFKRFAELNKIQFQAGWADENFINKFFEISKFNGIPQSFLIKDGKLRGIFITSSPKVRTALVNLVRKISAEEDLNQ